MRKVVWPALAIAALVVSGCGQASAKPSDLLIGKWRGTGDVTQCPQTELIFTRNTFRSIQAGKAYDYEVLGMDLQPDGKSVQITKMPGGVDPYWIIDNNHVQLQTPYAQCPYEREH